MENIVFHSILSWGFKINLSFISGGNSVIRNRKFLLAPVKGSSILSSTLKSGFLGGFSLADGFEISFVFFLTLVELSFLFVFLGVVGSTSGLYSGNLFVLKLINPLCKVLRYLRFAFFSSSAAFCGFVSASFSRFFIPCSKAARIDLSLISGVKFALFNALILSFASCVIFAFILERNTSLTASLIGRPRL